MNFVDTLHEGYLFKRRVRVLTRELANIVPRNARILDVGCGDGLVAKLVMERRPDVTIHGIDILIRRQTHIPVTQFDGQVIPYAAGSFDAVMFIDVLHHTRDPLILLREAVRVTRHALLLKDHCLDGWLAGPTLRLMDYVGNARHGVVLPYNFWPQARWQEAYSQLGLKVAVHQNRLWRVFKPLGTG